LSEDRRVAVVSGANRGLGREIARQLLGHGLAVIVGARDPSAGEETARELGDGAVPHQLDVTEPDSIDRLADTLDSDFGRCDVLVNNAAIYDPGGAAAQPDFDSIREHLETNLLGAWSLAAAAIPLMRRGGYGRIVNLSTGMAQLAGMNGGAPGYRVSKTGLNALTRMLASELRGTGILVNSVCPGWVQTDMGGRSAPRSVEEGADTAVWLATLPDDGPTGGFFRDRRPIEW
jgi:NAD(P)-dependent dehydrogenase (short-subunit alcohol dehydrogenase family)